MDSRRRYSHIGSGGRDFDRQFIRIQPYLRYSLIVAVEVEFSSGMTLLNRETLEVSGALAAAAVLGTAIAWAALRKRPTEEEIERERRAFLVQSGRLVDGMLLDICKLEADEGRTLTLLIFNYRISGVDYECSQDITPIRSLVDDAELRIGYPCTVRYQPGNPQNSIVIAEGWTGLRATLPQLRRFSDPDPIDRSHHRAGRRRSAAMPEESKQSVDKSA
jgi:hypothetical protein